MGATIVVHYCLILKRIALVIKNKNSHVKSMHSTSNKITSNNVNPIKIVERFSYRQQLLITKGIGVCCNIAGVPQILKKDRQTANGVWCVLLESGFDGDILFVHLLNKKKIPSKEQYTPQEWSTSNETFIINKVGNFEMSFPAFS